MPEIYKTKMTIRVQFAVEHRCDLTNAFVVTRAKCIACGCRLRQSQIEPLE